MRSFASSAAKDAATAAAESLTKERAVESVHGDVLQETWMVRSNMES